MSVLTSVEQDDWRATARAFFAAKSNEEQVRRLADDPRGYDPAVWTQLAEQMDLPGIVISEEFDGAGFSVSELVVTLEEMGRTLYSGPFLSSAVMAASLLLFTNDDEARSEYLPAIAAGSRLATTTLTELDSDGQLLLRDLTAGPVGEGWAVSGDAGLVLDGHVAELILVAAQGPDGAALLLAVEPGSSGVECEAVATMDQTRRFARIRFARADARLLAVPEPERVIEHTIELGALAVAAEQLGAAEAAFELTLAYVKERVQYGRPIGSFQAIKHRCADMLVQIEAARAAVRAAASATVAGRDDSGLLARTAKTKASEMFSTVAAETIQLHGGIGVTWEAMPHLFFKRAKSTRLMLGTPSQHRRAVAKALDIL